MGWSLFGRIARHPVRLGHNEREDRLTEIFAAVLDHPACIGLSQLIVSRWLAVETPKVQDDLPRHQALAEALRSREWDCEIRTQFSVIVDEERRRPDLELRFSCSDCPPILVYVEIKHGTAPHTRQLQAYLDDQRQRLTCLSVVTLVAPRSAYPFDKAEVPDDVPQVTWEATANILRQYLPASETGRLLVAELINYLREEDLMDPERVTPEHLVAIAHHKEAFAALERVYELADIVVAQQWAEPAAGHAGSYGRETWWRYPPQPEQVALGDWELAWHVFRESTQIFPDGKIGVPRIAAGAAADWGTLATLAPSACDALVAEGFQLFTRGELRGNTRERIWMLGYPEDLLAGASLEGQAKTLGRWIVEAFSRIQSVLAG